MGSFNIKCFVSGQVIAEHEKCRVAVILQSSTFRPAKLLFRGGDSEMYGIRHAGSGVDCNWEAMTAPLSGTYSDCSTFKFDETPENQAILAEFFNEMFRQAATTLADERNLVFDFRALAAEHAPKLHALLAAQKHFFESISPEQLDFEEAFALWDELQDAIVEERVFVANGSQVIRPLNVAAMHEVSYQRLVALSESTSNHSGLSYTRADYFSRAFDSLKEELATVDDDLKRFSRKELFREKLRVGLESRNAHPVTWVFRRRFEAAVDAVVEDGKPVSHFLEACKEPVETLYALRGLAILGVPYAPVVFAGQDNDNVTGKRYADFVAGAAEEISAGRKAWYE
jgi:hypothetical protein